jgi:hypothetical protein
MQAPYKNPYSFSEHASDRFTASYIPTPAPGLKNSHDTAPIVVKPQANNALPLPGAAEHNPSSADTTVESLVYFKLRSEPGREVMGVKSERFM